MPWFQKACYHLGLTIHHAVKPVKDHHKTEVHRSVEEKQLNATTTLRRTTIDEIEITLPGNQPPKPPPE